MARYFSSKKGQDADELLKELNYQINHIRRSIN